MVASQWVDISALITALRHRVDEALGYGPLSSHSVDKIGVDCAIPVAHCEGTGQDEFSVIHGI